MYPHYDIVLWSQTHWKWLEIKLVELGIIGSDAKYKITFVADRTTMFPVREVRRSANTRSFPSAMAKWSSTSEWKWKHPT